MYKIDLNCDLGESYGAYHLGMDEEIIPLISSANVACGFHAGDFNTMAKTARLCAENGVSMGAHPGFPDLQGFGRRNMSLSPVEVRNLITYQVGALSAFCRSAAAFSLASLRISSLRLLARSVAFCTMAAAS